MNPKNILMIGIKGVGMTPVALMYKQLGHHIVGVDSKNSQITDEVLKEEGIKVYDFESYKIDDRIDLVIYSGAYDLRRHPLLRQLDARQIPCITQAQSLAEHIKKTKLIAVCGVGGKTTTSAALAHVFSLTDQNSGWFVGVSQICGELLPGRIAREDNWFVAEADEYSISTQDKRPKFALFDPQIIILTNLVHDHPDVYSNLDQTLSTFVSFINRLPSEGVLLTPDSNPHLSYLTHKLRADIKLITYGYSDQAAWQIKPESSGFAILSDNHKLHLKPSVFGPMNVLNLTAALAASTYRGLDPHVAARHLGSFTGTKRRLEHINSKNGVDYYDDYAHHPIEIQAVIQALRQQFGKKRIVVAFHPHTYSRTKSLLREFEKSLSNADVLVLAPIFASAREQEDPSISSHILASNLKEQGVEVYSKNSLADVAQQIKQIVKPGDVVITLGAGDIYTIHNSL